MAGAAALSRQQLRIKRRIEAAVAELDDMETSQLDMTVADFNSRLPAPALTAAPFNTYADWLQLFTFGHVMPDTGELGPLCDLYQCAGDALSTTAYSPRQAYARQPALSRQARA